MREYFKSICEDLSHFKVSSSDAELVVSAVRLNDVEMQSILFTASNGDKENKLLFEVSTDGLCYFTSYSDGKPDRYSTDVEAYDTAHYDYGFYHRAEDGIGSQFSYNGCKVVTIEVMEHALKFDVDIPDKVRNGAAINELGFAMQAHQLLLCIAKLCGSYAFSNMECSVLDSVCPKLKQTVPVLNEFQLKMLKKEYELAYDAYISGEGVDEVLPMILHTVVKYGTGDGSRK